MNSSAQDYPLPDDETARLRKLHEFEILDSPEEPCFDNLTRLATDMFDMPISLVCLVDETRQWFKSHTGWDIRETERECSFCNHLLLSRNVTTIENAKEDDRVSDNRLVIDEPHIRSYVGAPLETRDGHVLGSFCLLGKKPREFTRTELSVLRRFATEAMNQIELRYENSQRRKLNEQLQQKIREQQQEIEKQQLEYNELLHRTKNHFNNIKSLLNLQKTEAENEREHLALEKAEIRLHAFLCIHEQLNETRKLNTISSKQYLKSIIRKIDEVFEDEAGSVGIETRIDDEAIPSDVAVNLGIAINELMTNAYEHVFIPGKGSNLWIDFRVEPDEYELTIRDDGPGFSSSDGPDREGTQGLDLIDDIIGHEAHGSFDCESNGQTTFTIRLGRDS